MDRVHHILHSSSPHEHLLHIDHVAMAPQGHSKLRMFEKAPLTSKKTIELSKISPYILSIEIIHYAGKILQLHRDENAIVHINTTFHQL